MEKAWCRGWVVVLVLSLGLLASIGDHALAGERDRHDAPDPTEDRHGKIDELRTACEQEGVRLRSELRVKRAELDALLLAEKPDRVAIHGKVDEMSSLDTAIRRTHMDTYLAVRQELPAGKMAGFRVGAPGTQPHGMGPGLLPPGRASSPVGGSGMPPVEFHPGGPFQEAAQGLPWMGPGRDSPDRRQPGMERGDRSRIDGSMKAPEFERGAGSRGPEGQDPEPQGRRSEQRGTRPEREARPSEKDGRRDEGEIRRSEERRAEPGRRTDLPDLTEEQRERIKALRTACEREVLPLMAELKVRQAELDAFLVAEEPDGKAVYRKLDEMNTLHSAIQKERIDTNLDIREVLTPEQRMQFHRGHLPGLQGLGENDPSGGRVGPGGFLPHGQGGNPREQERSGKGVRG